MKKSIVIVISILALVGFGWFFASSYDNTGQTANVAGTNVGIDIGGIAPVFQVTTIDGRTITSEDTQGKVVVITSSAAWCQTCVLEAQQFAPVYKKYKDQSVVFITVDIDPQDSKKFIEQFRQENDTPWNYADAQGGSQLIKDYKFNRFEITYVVDKEGVIRFKDGIITSTDKLIEAIEKLL